MSALIATPHGQIRDAYIAGPGEGQVFLLSAIPIESERGAPEMNSGALYRYLAEAPWYATALLPSANLRWTAVNDVKALATLTDSGNKVSLEFRFNALVVATEAWPKVACTT